MTYIYFDLGNVLVHFDPQRACQNVASLLGCDVQEVDQAMYGSGLEETYERGEMGDAEFVASLCRALGRTAEVNLILEAMADMFVPHDAMLPLISELRQQKIPLGILSNTCAAHWCWVQKQNWEVASGWWRDAVLSYEVGAMKPEAAIYRCAQERAGVRPEQIFFTDDRPENVEAARQHGWYAVPFLNPQKLRHDLETFGLPTAP